MTLDILYLFLAFFVLAASALSYFLGAATMGASERALHRERSAARERERNLRKELKDALERAKEAKHERANMLGSLRAERRRARKLEIGLMAQGANEATLLRIAALANVSPEGLDNCRCTEM